MVGVEKSQSTSMPEYLVGGFWETQRIRGGDKLISGLIFNRDCSINGQTHGRLRQTPLMKTLAFFNSQEIKSHHRSIFSFEWS